MGATVQVGRYGYGLGAWTRKEIDLPILLTYFLLFYLFTFPGSDFSALCLWGHESSLLDFIRTLRYFGHWHPWQSGEPVCSIPAVSSLFLLSGSGYSLPALPLSDRFPRAAGMSSDFTEIFEEELTFKTDSCVRAVFKLCSLESWCTLGTITGVELRSFSLSSLPHYQVNQNSYTLIKNSFWGKLVWKKGFHCFYF